MTVDDCFQLGYVIKPHGLDGAVDVFIDSDYPENYNSLESVLVQQRDELVPFFISSLRFNGNKAIIHFEDVDTKDKALTLKGCTLHLPLDMLPPLKGNSFYFHEVIGFEIHDLQLGRIGQVDEVYNYPSQDFLVLKREGKEALIPINDNIILSVDRNSKLIEVDLPDGLMDIYL